ncbi:MAG: cytochrome c [Deltaproteobacteria bacterium]|nr:cytochrome c [Deltaproteobacteria bacterium]MCB9788297.1 cytochrome c [Deltaproteobacteria bacterium]
MLLSRIVLLGAAATLVALGAGCRGTTSPVPPVHLNWNMDFQQRYEMQEKNPFFADGRAMRQPVEGTVAREAVLQGDDPWLAADDHLYRGRGPDGRLVDALPKQIPLTPALLERGQARYTIYCAPCHSPAGTGDGVIAGRGLKVQPPSYLSANLRAMPLGYFFDVISHGVRTMQPYGSQVPVEDRWAIAAWVRTLQVSGNVPRSEVPADVLQKNAGGTK